VDTDLRWALLSCLSANGRVDDAEIERQLQQDNTISGQERAAAARAVIPSAETKAQAWADAALSNEVSNETMRSIAYVFDASEQADVLEPYLEKYLAVADTIWEDQGTQIASTMLEYMFPRALTSRATLERVDAWLATSQANPAAKRLGGEAGADIARARAAPDPDA
jgi:aminopeptidase N